MVSWTKSVLFRSSFVLLISFNIFNALNFLFGFAMVRLLSLPDYGTLTALNYIIVFFTVFGESIQTIVARYTVNENDPGKVKAVLVKSLKKAIVASGIVFLIYLILAIFLSSFLRIEYALVALTGTLIFMYFLTPIVRGVLQGKKRFFSLGNNVIGESAVKLVLGIAFVSLGAAVYGALIGILLGSVFAFLISFISLKDFLKEKKKVIQTPDIYSYSWPVGITVLLIILFFTIDIILAKRFFSPEDAGIYAIAATLSKIVFVGTQPISRAMFPISAEEKDSIRSKGVLIRSASMLGLILIGVLAVVFLFPEQIINAYSGKSIAIAAQILPILSLAMCFLALANIVLFYKISRGKVKNKLLLSFVFIAPLVLYLSNSNLYQYSIGFLFVTALFLIATAFLSYESKHNHTGP